MVKPAYAQTTAEEPVLDTSFEDFDWDSYYKDFNWENEMSTTTVPSGDLVGLFAGAFGVTLVFMIIFTCILSLAMYIYTSLALMKIAQRLDEPNAWFAWIPILNMVLLLKLGDQNPWVLLLILIPGIGALVLTVITVIAMMRIAERRGYDKLLGLLNLVPVANLVLLGILAWGKKE